MWPLKYISIPFADKGRTMEQADCWGLVRLIYKQELNIDLPDYLDAYDHSTNKKVIAEHVDNVKQQWKEVADPKEFDVVLLNTQGVPMHVGVITKKNTMIHCVLGVGTSIENYNSMRWKERLAGFYRYE